MSRKLTILLVEDDIVDVKCVERALREVHTEVETEVAGNGRIALDRLRQSDGPGSPMPSLIVADLNMPVMDGLELLEALKNDNRLRKIPVVVLTTSNNRRDVDASYDRGAAGYIVKPMEADVFRNMLSQVCTYWSTCESPGT
jgi:CheY-like chemotaxis protein